MRENESAPAEVPAGSRRPVNSRRRRAVVAAAGVHVRLAPSTTGALRRFAS